MHFTKMNGAGNDFIIVNNIREKLKRDSFSHIARRLCTRRLSIGADGMMFVEAAENGGDYRMVFYNADGSEANMCGNGARCIARYGYENGLAGETQRVETAAGLVIGQRISERQYRVRLNDPGVFLPRYPVTVDGAEYDCAYVEIGSPGVPHAVVPVDLDSIPRDALLSLGRALRYHPAFPNGANVNFIKLKGENELDILTYERGVEDFTYACGTGCGASAAVFAVRGLISGNETLLHAPGGDLHIDLSFTGEKVNDIYLTGPTNIVAEGDVTDEEL